MEGFLSRAGGVANSLFGAAPAAGLNPQQNEAARKAALNAAGLQMIMNARSGIGQAAPGTLQILASGMMAGQQAGGAARAQQQAQMAIQNPALTLTPQQRAMLMALPPDQQAAALQELLTRGPGDPKVVGTNLVSAAGEVLYQGPGAPEDPWKGVDGTWRALLAAQGVTDPNQATAQQWLRAVGDAESLGRARAATTSINVTNADKAAGDVARDQYEQAYAMANEADQLNSQIAQMEYALSQGMDTGAFANATVGLRGFLADLGVPIDTENLSNQQVFMAAANQAALVLRSQMPGPMSDGDRKFLVNSVPNLGNQMLANELMIEMLKRMASRRYAFAVAYEEWLRANPTGEGVLRFKSDWAQANPLDFSDIRGRADVQQAIRGGN